MKSLRIVMLLGMFCLFCAPMAYAQNGAFVVRDNDLFGWADWNGENVLAMHASELDGFCNWPDVTDPMLADVMGVFRPDGTIKYKDKGFLYTRVFYPATPDDLGSDYCVLWNSTDLLIAEGITHYVYNDNHLNAEGVPHNRRNAFGYTVSGGLYDMTGMCSSGMMDFNTVRKFLLDKNFPECLPDDCDSEVQVWKGPDIDCAE